jgi:hypothetical protein
VRGRDVHPALRVSLESHPHFHIVAFDGVYAAADGETPRFYPLHPPEKKDVAAIAGRVAERVSALLESDDEDKHPKDEGLAGIYSASIAQRVGVGPHYGQKIRTAGALMEYEQLEEDFRSGRSRSAQVSGFSVHAGVAVRARERKALERLCKYAARPALAMDRLTQLPDGRLSYRLKTPWRNGTTHVIFDVLDFIAKLAGFRGKMRHARTAALEVDIRGIRRHRLAAWENLAKATRYKATRYLRHAA